MPLARMRSDDHTGRADGQRSGSVLHLRLRAAIDSVPTARHTVRSWLDELELPRDVVEDLALAVTELVTNAVEASPSAASEISVQASCNDHHIYLEVVDDGPGFDLDDTNVAHGPGPQSIRGRGLSIVQALVDLVSVERSAERTRVIATRRLAPQRS